MSPEDLVYKITKKVNSNIGIKEMINYLKSWLNDYKISTDRTMVVFKSEI